MQENNKENMFESCYDSTLPLDLEETRKSNILITGTNQQGKSLAAMSISDRLMLNHGKS